MTDRQAAAIRQVIATWRERARTMRLNAKDTVVESLIAQRADAFVECADELEAALGEAPAATVQGDGIAAGRVMICPFDNEPCIAACVLDDLDKHPVLMAAHRKLRAARPQEG